MLSCLHENPTYRGEKESSLEGRCDLFVKDPPRRLDFGKFGKLNGKFSLREPGDES